MSPPTSPPTVAPRAVAVIVVAMAALLALEAPLWGRGWIGNEFALLEPVSAWRMLGGTETAINPPLYPFLLNALVPHPWVLPVGRALSVAASLLAVALAGASTARAHPGRTLLVALVLAGLVGHPLLADYGTRVRVYALAWPVWVLHLHAGRQARTGGPAGPLFWGTALALPWLHYLFFPIVAASVAWVVRDPAARGGLRRGAVAAAIAWAPLAGFLLTGADGTPGPEPDGLGMAARFGMSHGTLGAAAVAAVAMLAAAPMRRDGSAADPGHRYLAGMALVTWAVLTVAAAVVRVRTPAWSLVVVPWALALASTAPLRPWRLLPVAVLGVLAVQEVAVRRTLVEPGDTVREAIAADALHGDVAVSDRSMVAYACLELTGRHLARAGDAACGDACFAFGDLRVHALPPGPGGQVLWTGANEATPPTGCDVAWRGDKGVLFTGCADAGP